MCKVLAVNIEKDDKRNIRAIWNDESHLNWCVANKNKKILSPAYCWPEGGKEKHNWFTWIGEPKIIALNKDHGAYQK